MSVAPFKQTSFSLPSARAAFVQDPSGKQVFLQKDHDVFLVLGARVLKWTEHEHIVDVFLEGNRGYSFLLQAKVSKDLGEWLVASGVTVTVALAKKEMVSVKGPTDSKTPIARTVETCPECYGTGHYKGFGAPCSKGCK